MSVPILKQSHYLIVTLQSALTDTDLIELRDALVEKVGVYRSRGVIVYLSALDARSLRAPCAIWLI